MINGKFIENLVDEFLNGKELFLVSVKVSKNNIITVTIDSDNKVTVESCIEVSKFIEKHLDRDKEDFELTVTSFGLGDFFTLGRQYKKNIGENVEVVLKDGTKENGILSAFDGQNLTIAKKTDTSINLDINEVDKTRIVFNF
ncbi:MAG: ribosome assembly cofactor RimP [Bacteroidales bacterium]|nr:ribosome assembly cofactor RimP [Bacteroidales bacterium]